MQPAKATMADLEQMGAESPSPELLCRTLAQILRVRRNEVALLRLEKNCLRFVFPTELRAAGALPLSGPAVAARTASARSSLLSNSFARVRHASLFETVKLGAAEADEPPHLDGEAKVAAHGAGEGDLRGKISVRAGDGEKVKALLKGNPDLVFSKDTNGWTPLHFAADRGDKDLVELLLANKADVNAKAAYSGELVHRFRWKWSSVGESDAGLRT